MFLFRWNTHLSWIKHVEFNHAGLRGYIYPRSGCCHMMLLCSLTVFCDGPEGNDVIYLNYDERLDELLLAVRWQRPPVRCELRSSAPGSAFTDTQQTQFTTVFPGVHVDVWLVYSEKEEGGCLGEGVVFLSPPRLNYYSEATDTKPALTASSVTARRLEIFIRGETIGLSLITLIV